MRHVFVLGLTIAIVATASHDLAACGDKFLRIGRSARFPGYAAVHPAAILIYSPADATAEGIKTLEAMLKRAGHTPRVLTHGTALQQTVTAADFDLVIAAYADAGKIKEQLESLPSRPEVLPILNKPTKAVAAEAEKAYRFLLKPHAMSKSDALTEIDRLMALRLNETATQTRTR